MKKKSGESNPPEITRLDKVLAAFENSLTDSGVKLNPDPQKDLEEALWEYARETVRHPVSSYFSELCFRTYALTLSLEEMKRALAKPDEMARAAEFVDACYEENTDANHLLEMSSDITRYRHRRNPFELPPEEMPDQNDTPEQHDYKVLRRAWREFWIEEDLRETPYITKEMVQRQEEEVVKLENLRNGIFTTIKLIHELGKEQKGFVAEKRRGELYLRLLDLWSGFRASMEELEHSIELSQLFMAAKELSASRNFSKLPMADLPARLYKRLEDHRRQYEAIEFRAFKGRRRRPGELLPPEIPLKRKEPRKEVETLPLEDLIGDDSEDQLAILGKEEEVSGEVNEKLEFEAWRQKLFAGRDKLNKEENALIDRRLAGDESPLLPVDRQRWKRIKEKLS